MTSLTDPTTSSEDPGSMTSWIESTTSSFATSIGSTQLKWEANYLEAFINSYCDENKLKFRDIGLPLRIIITGSMSSPSIVHIMEILGEEEILKRLKIGIS